MKLTIPANDNAPPAAVEPVDPWAQHAHPALPQNLLLAAIESFARAQAEIMGVDPGGLAMACLAVAAAALPDKIEVQVKRHDENWTESARSWVALIGDPSTKKSPTISSAAAPLKAIDADMHRRFASARAAYDALSKDAKAGVEAPTRERLRLEDTTVEAAGEILRDSPNGVLCLQDELSGWFGAMDKYSGNRGAAKDRAFWLQAFNGGSYTVNRIGRGDVWIDNLSVSMLGGIQPEPMRKVAAAAVDDGLLQRLFPVVLKRAAVGKDVPAPGQASTYGDLIHKLHRMEKPRAGALLDTRLCFDDEAQAIRNNLEQIHHDLATAWEGVTKKLAAHFGKYDGLFARLCVLWHCAETVTDRPHREINSDVANRVARFMAEFLRPHAIAFYADVLGLSDRHDALLATAGWILANRPNTVTVRDIQRGDRVMRALDKRAAEEVLERLDAFGWLEPVPQIRRDSARYIVRPAVFTAFEARAVAERERRARVREIIAEADKA